MIALGAVAFRRSRFNKIPVSLPALVTNTMPGDRIIDIRVSVLDGMMGSAAAGVRTCVGPATCPASEGQRRSRQMLAL